MDVRPWLQGLQKQLRSRCSRRSAARGLRSGNYREIQKLEDRTLLVSTVLLAGTELKVLSDADEDIIVREDPANSQHIEVLVNGSPSTSVGVVRADFITTLTVVTGDEDNSVDLSSVDAAVFVNLTTVNVATGNGDDAITGSPNISMTADAGDGDDVIVGFAGRDTILGGDGNDDILGGSGADSIDAGDGNDVVNGEAGDDTIFGDDGRDTINGGDDSDSIFGGDGEDSLLGDAGTDFLQGDLGNDTISGGAVADTVFGGGGADEISGDDGDDLLFGNGGRDTIDGQAGNDVINVGNGADSAQGGDGNDSVIGGLGDDTIDGGAGNDTLNGGGGDDSILGDGPDPAIPLFGDDLILGQSGDDTLIGTRGADTITGGPGDDSIQSTLIEEVVAPPAPPVPLPPPPPMPGGPGGGLPDAVDSGEGVDVGFSYQLTTGPGDGNVDIDSVSATGNFTSAVYDPVGAINAAEVSFGTDVYFRPDLSGAGPRTTLDFTAQNVSSIRGSNNSEANSTFTIGNLSFALTQQTVQTFDALNVQDGSLLIQSYRITNTGQNQEEFELTRYWDADLGFDGSLIDGGGRVISSAGDEILFEVEQGQVGSSATTFVGITGRAAMTVDFLFGRYEINQFPTLNFGLSGGANLQNTIFNDGDGDGFIDPGNEYDVTLALTNLFSISAGETELYTTHTLFGNGVPNNIGPVNMPPMAVDDTTGNQTVSSIPLTIDIVSNDSDPDGALDFSTIAVTQPANGSVVNLGNGLVTYTANEGFAGTDSFTYTIMDNSGATSNTATVSVAVSPGDQTGDLLDGSEGNDTLLGAGGNDTIIGSFDDDNLRGGGGDDSLLGAAGNDTLDGEEGDDTLLGQGGQDLLNGGDGEDSMVWRGTSDGHDTVSGGAGGDGVEVRGNSIDNNFGISQTVEGRLRVENGPSVLTVDFDVKALEVNTGTGDDVVTIGDVSQVVLSTLTVNGDAGNDLLTAAGSTPGSVRIAMNGGAGTDSVFGGDGAETLSGGDDDDVLAGGGGNDLLNGDDGADAIGGDDGDDTINGGAGNDAITAGNGDDSVSGGNDNDTIDGGSGDDTLRGQFGDDSLIGSFGADSMDGGLGSDDLIGGAGDDSMDGGRNNDVIIGNSGNDTLLGNHGNDIIRGNGGDDEILAGDGDDTVFAGDGEDGVSGGDGDDRLFGDNGSDVIVGGDGDDSLHGGGAPDTVLGQEGNDTLTGAGGNSDIVAGGEGINELDPLETGTSQHNELFMLTSDLLEKLDGV